MIISSHGGNKQHAKVRSLPRLLKCQNVCVILISAGVGCGAGAEKNNSGSGAMDTVPVGAHFVCAAGTGFVRMGI